VKKKVMPVKKAKLKKIKRHVAIANEIFEHQDLDTQAALDRIAECFPPRDGMYVATEIVKDMAQMDVQVANFEFPPKLCAECGDEIKPKKKA
jgi:hypothetical protein